MAENEKTEKAFATNQFDVQIAQIKAEQDKVEFQFTSELMKLRAQGQEKTNRMEKIVSSSERVILSGMVLAGVIFVTDKRYNIVEHIADTQRV